MRAHDIPFLFLTNNSEQTPLDLLRKLEGMGIHGLTEANFITAAIATAQFLHAQRPHSTAYVVGGSGLAAELYKVGYSITESHPEYVVVGKTSNFSFATMRKAAQLIDGGAKFIGTNPDLIDPVEGGTEPAAGVILAAIEAATGRKPYIVGKPNSLMMIYARQMLGAHAEDCVMIGDRMDTDIVGGLEAGMRTALVLSGVSSQETIEQFPYRPDFVFDSVGSIDWAALAAGVGNAARRRRGRAVPPRSRSPRCCGSSPTRSTSSASTCAATASTGSRCSTARAWRTMLGQTVAISLDSSEIKILLHRDRDRQRHRGRRHQRLRPAPDHRCDRRGRRRHGDRLRQVRRLPDRQAGDRGADGPVQRRLLPPPGASLKVAGKRVSCPAELPFGVVLDTAVIANSPARFTYSGVGDLLTKYSAVTDWKLAYWETGEQVNDFAVLIALQSVDNLVNHPNKSIGDLDFIKLMAGGAGDERRVDGGLGVLPTGIG